LSTIHVPVKCKGSSAACKTQTSRQRSSYFTAERSHSLTLRSPRRKCTFKFQQRCRLELITVMHPAVLSVDDYYYY